MLAGMSVRNSRAVVHGVEHVGGDHAVAIDPVGGPRDQGHKVARPLDQLGAALRLVGGA